MIVDAGLKGMAKTMINDMNAKFFAELAKGTLVHDLKDEENLSYDAIVDAIGKLSVQDNVIGGVNVEDESGLIILVGADMRADLRKDDDFVRANQGAILFSGQIGSVCGIPVVHSRMVPEKTAYVFTKEAVTLFVKKDSEVEQERKANTRTNEVYARKVNLCALTDDTKVIRIVKK
jgi:N4-gp56 family major capsid protein